MLNIFNYDVTFPENVFYSEQRAWLRKNNQNNFVIGLSDLIVGAAAHLMYINIEVNEGDILKKGQEYAELETSKTVEPLYAPISGIVIKINPNLIDGNPELITNDTYGDGWLFEIKPTNDIEMSSLKDGNKQETKNWISETAGDYIAYLNS